MDKNFLKILLVSALTVMLVSLSRAQEACEVVKAFDDGSYKVKIGDREYRAITEDQMKKLLKLDVDLTAARKEIMLKDTLLASFEKAKWWYDQTMSQQKDYITEMESVLAGYKKLIRDYKRLREPWITFDGGIGATGDKKMPVVLFGIGIQKFQVWSLLQESNSGFLAGVKFKLF